MLYVAYGSNIPSRELLVRCPSAKFVGKGYIENYKLRFNMYADVSPSVGDRVPCVVYDITNDKDWEMLDYYEGYPTLYTKHNVSVTLENIGDIDVECVVYEMVDNFKIVDKLPSDSYINRVLVGYEEYKLDVNYFKTALVNAR